MLFGSMPLSVLAMGVGAAAGAIDELSGGDSLPVVSVQSLYSYGGDTPTDIRALPDYEGNFYLDISLDKAPATDENILVYYRTVDDSAVAAWGDYESVGTPADTYVTLNKSNVPKVGDSLPFKRLKTDISHLQSNSVLWAREKLLGTLASLVVPFQHLRRCR